MRSVLVLGLAVVGSAAHGSFELLLVADNGVGTFASRKIHRFDPVSKTYLGSFGGFNSSILATHLNQATNSLFVIAASTVSEWDYNTGLLKNSFGAFLNPANGIAVRPSGDRMMELDGASDLIVRDFPTLGGASFTGAVAGGAIYRQGFWLNDTSAVAFEAAQSRFVNLTFNAGATVATVGTITPGGAAHVAGTGQAARNAGGTQVIMPNGSMGGFFAYTPGAGGYSNFQALVPGVATSAASAHTGFFLGSRSGGVGRIDAFDRQFQLVSQFGSSFVADPVSMQTVLAPEPGTLAALGIGALALLRKRRK